MKELLVRIVVRHESCESSGMNTLVAAIQKESEFTAKQNIQTLCKNRLRENVTDLALAPVDEHREQHFSCIHLRRLHYRHNNSAFIQYKLSASVIVIFDDRSYFACFDCIPSSSRHQNNFAIELGVPKRLSS